MSATAFDLEQLYHDRFVGFQRALSNITGSQASAEDALQEAFVRALTRIDTYRGDAPLAAWVWRIAVNVAAEQRRDNRRRIQREDRVVPHVASADTETGQLLDRLRELPHRRRLIAFLRYFADCSYTEIAGMCEISEGTVAASLAQTRETLARELELDHGTIDAQEVTR